MKYSHRIDRHKIFRLKFTPRSSFEFYHPLESFTRNEVDGFEVLREKSLYAAATVNKYLNHYFKSNPVEQICRKNCLIAWFLSGFSSPNVREKSILETQICIEKVAREVRKTIILTWPTAPSEHNFP